MGCRMVSLPREVLHHLGLERVRAFWRQEQGANLALFGVLLLALLGFAGLAIDGSNIYYQNQRMQIAADAAALGGARQLALGAVHGVVHREIEELAFANDADGVVWDYINSNRGVHVVASRTFEAYFARLYGYDHFTVQAESEAQYEPVTGVDELFPITIDCDCVGEDKVTPGGGDPGGGSTPTPTPTPEEEEEAGMDNLLPMTIPCSTELMSGEIYDIWNSSDKSNRTGSGIGKEGPGAFGWLDWNGGSRGNPELEDNIRYPQNSGFWKVGDWVDSGPGVQNSSGVKAALDLWINKPVMIPLYDQIQGNGANLQYRICDFAQFVLLGYDFQGSDKYVTGRFVSTTGTVTLTDAQSSSYSIAYVGRSGNTWTYRVTEMSGSQDLSSWQLGINTCLQDIVTASPTEADFSVGGINWGVAPSFTGGTFSFTLNDDYPAGMVNAAVQAGSSTGTVRVQGPICDGTNTGNAGQTGTANVCLPVLDFETDAAGAALATGQIIDTEWAAWGVRVASSNSSHPAMIFNSASPTGGDTDLGSPNEAFGGPGKGHGGGTGAPGRNAVALGKVLIVAERDNPSNPDDKADGGTLIFSFDYPVRVDELTLMDIDDAGAAGTIKAYNDAAGSALVATGKMLGLGDNSVQTVALNAKSVRRLEVKFNKGGALAALTSCRSGSQATYQVSNLIWSDVNKNGLQDTGEAGIPGVVVELYATGQSQAIATTTTNAGGEYRFSGLPAGSYEVKIAAGNFASGKPLAGASHSPVNVGTDTGRDSNFVDGKAAVVLTNADNATIDGGFILASAPAASAAPSVVNLRDNKDSKYQIELAGVSGTTWTYKVSEISGRDLSHWNLGIVNCLDKISSASPTSGYASGRDGSTGFVGIKWDVNDSFKQGTFSFTLNGNYAMGNIEALAKAGNASATTQIAGPDCSETITEPPVTPPNPDPGDQTAEGGGGGGTETNACSFGFLDWSGGPATYMELQGYMNNTSQSGVWRLRQVVPAGPKVVPNALVENALENRKGTTVKIPLAEYNGSGYAICGFATVKLVDFGNENGDLWLNLEFLKTLVNGVETDPNAEYFGASDVRFHR